MFLSCIPFEFCLRFGKNWKSFSLFSVFLLYFYYFFIYLFFVITFLHGGFQCLYSFSFLFFSFFNSTTLDEKSSLNRNRNIKKDRIIQTSSFFFFERKKERFSKDFLKKKSLKNICLFVCFLFFCISFKVVFFFDE